MKTFLQLMIFWIAMTLTPSWGADAAPGEPIATPTNSATVTNTPSVQERREARQERRAERQARREVRRQNAATAASSGTNPPLAVGETHPTEPVVPEKADLRLNFRGVSLDVILDYLSEAAGYTIVLETPVKGTVDVWSNQPLTRTEALDLLNSVLNKNGYAAIQNGKTLTVVARDEAKKRDIPIRIGSAHQEIPKNDQIITQVIPVRNINVAQLARDLAPLVPTSAAIVANEGANTLLVTTLRPAFDVLPS